MDLSAVLTEAIVDLCSGVSLGPDSVIDPLRALSHDLELVTRSYLGLQMVLTDEDRIITLTSFEPLVQFEDIVTSLQLPLVMLSPSTRPGSALTLYAAAPGAFVDLAADLSHAVGSGYEPRLDLDLIPRSITPGLANLDEVSTINRAIGWLIDRGFEPETAPRELARGAAAAGGTVPDYAAELLRAG